MVPVLSASVGMLGPLLGKLTALLAGEYGRLKGVRREILSLRCELSSMHAAIKKYAMLQDPDVQVKEWMSIMRELAYDIEDCIDKFIHKLGNVRRHGRFKELFRKTADQLKTLRSRHGIATEINNLKARLKQVKELKSSYKLDDVACSTSGNVTVDPRLHALFAEKADLVGIDGPRDDLSKWMLEEENTSTKHHRRVLSIVGSGGLGKSTLANEIDHKIQGHFDCRAFVSVSQKIHTKSIIKDVISQVISEVPCKDGFTKDTDHWYEKKSAAKDRFTEDSDIWDEKKCTTKLRELLRDKRYLIIIDDIWSIPAWDAIKCAFLENNCSSRVIVTTRILDVASSCCSGSDDCIYEMEPLSELHSKRLFFKRIFGSEDCPSMLKEVSNEILKKCGGLPLAITSISGLLAKRPPIKEEWERVKRSIGSEIGRSQNLEGMENILSLSYNDFPPNLKTCLLYLSCFPEDFVIEREMLVRRWIAEGFISAQRGQSQQEVAESYFYELINKNMVQPVDIGYDGKARACKVHDIMLELIISKCAEENFITVVNGEQSFWESSNGFIRRLSVQHIDQELAPVLANKDLHHVRSLTVTGSGCVEHLPGLVEFEALRVLDFGYCEALKEYDLDSMDKLFQLKYLSFRSTGISRVLAGIVMLLGLETRDLRDTNIQELPAKIVQLINLRHLLTATHYGYGRTKIPNGIVNMRNLQVISGFNITYSSVDAIEELGKLTNLNQLHIELTHTESYVGHEEMLLSSLCKLGSCKLRSLWIYSCDLTCLDFLQYWSPLPSSLQRFMITTTCYFVRTPKWIAPAFTSLAYLDINLTEITEEDLRMLGELPALRFLRLCLKSDPNERLTIQGFPSLNKFVLVCRSVTGGAYVTFLKGAMPKLQYLELPLRVSIAATYGFYFGIEHLLSLKEAKSVSLQQRCAVSSSQAAAAIRNEACSLPNHPKVTIWGEEHRVWGMKCSSKPIV